MKRIVITLVCIIVLAVIAVAIWRVWFSGEVSHRLWTSNVVKERAIAALDLEMVIERLDVGEIDRARELLNQRLDGEILILGAMLEDAPTDETYVWVTKTLARIGRHRAETTLPRSGESAGPGLVEQDVQSILEKAIAESPELTAKEPALPKTQ